VWVQLLSVKQIEVRGVSRTYHAGDWVEVGRHIATQWLADGSARTMPAELARNLPGCGVVLTGDGAAPGLQDALDVMRGEPSLPYPRTLIWDPAQTLRRELLPSGFHLLDTWDAACPLYDYNLLARDYGDESDRAQTAAVIRDLRVMLYEPRVLFVRRCEASLRLVETWQKERERGDDRLAFLRAFYRVKPRLCALPVTWIGKQVE